MQNVALRTASLQALYIGAHLEVIAVVSISVVSIRFTQ